MPDREDDETMSTATMTTTHTDFLYSHAAAYAGGDYRADDYADWYVERYGECEPEEWEQHPRAWVEFLSETEDDSDDIEGGVIVVPPERGAEVWDALVAVADEQVREANLAADIERDGYSLEAVRLWADLTGHDLTEWDRPTREAFEDSYEGHHDSQTDFVRSLVDDIGLLANVPEEVAAYFDVHAYARDLFLSGSYTACDASTGGAYIFSHS